MGDKPSRVRKAHSIVRTDPSRKTNEEMAKFLSPRSPKAQDEGYLMGVQSASELTEEIDDFLEKTESEYISDDDEMISDTIDDLRAALRSKDKNIKSLRAQLQTAKRIVTRNKAINQETNRELTEVLQEVLILRERNKTLEQTLEMFKSQAEQGSKASKKK